MILEQALYQLFAIEFKSKLHNVENPYGKGGASEAIVQTLGDTSFYNLQKKTFHNFPAI